MCGITGVIHKSGLLENGDELRRMNDLISHRGPDGEGFYIDGKVGFGHRRLAIIDLTDDGLQPMHYRDQYTITYNGEVYNYIELREELKKAGHRFKSLSDTEVILAAYSEWGEDCVTRFNGMWAFAIHDKGKQIVFCSRDRFGVKPFYYRETADELLFSSEIKQLLNPEGQNRANRDLLGHYLLTGMHDHDERTFFEGIRKLPPSHNLVFDLNTGSHSIRQYYSIQPVADSPDYEDSLINAIKLRLRSDVKVGTCLSGGLDSSTVAAIASEIYSKESGERFSAIHAKSIEKASDESAFAKEVATHANLDLHVIEPSSEDFCRVLEEVVYTQEEPFASPSIYLQYFVMKEASRINCKVMLDGQGGDETLLGYERYYAPAFACFWKEKGMLKALKEMISSGSNNSKMGFTSILKYLAGTFLLVPRALYLRRKFRFLKSNNLPQKFEYWEKIRDNALDIFCLQEAELYYTNLQALLRYEDKNSMRHGIETRLPFIDYRAVEASLNLPIEKKIHNGWTKYVLRQICERYLPSRIAWRKNKLGFNAPDKTWLSGLETECGKEITNSFILEEFIDKKKLGTYPYANNWTMTWRLYNIALWERIYKVHV